VRGRGSLGLLKLLPSWSAQNYYSVVRCVEPRNATARAAKVDKPGAWLRLERLSGSLAIRAKVLNFQLLPGSDYFSQRRPKLGSLKNWLSRVLNVEQRYEENQYVSVASLAQVAPTTKVAPFERQEPESERLRVLLSLALANFIK